MKIKINEDKLVAYGFEWNEIEKYWELPKEMYYIKDTEVDTHYDYYIESDDVRFDWYIPSINLYVSNGYVDFIEDDLIDIQELV